MKKLTSFLFSSLLLPGGAALLLWFKYFIYTQSDPTSFLKNKVLLTLINFSILSLISLYVVGLIYSFYKKIDFESKPKKTIGFVLLCFMVLAAFSYFTTVSDNLYERLKTNRKGISGDVYRFDEVIGIVPRENSKGMHLIPDRANIVMSYDKNGFRIPEDSTDPPDGRVKILFAGCSFTYGDFCKAEESFPYLVQEALNFQCHNSGVCGYGALQMLERSRRLLSDNKMNVLVFQDSPWLYERAIEAYSPSYFGVIPKAYLRMEDGKIVKHRPMFRSSYLTIDFDYFRNTPPSLRDYFKYQFRIALPMLMDKLKQYFHSLFDLASKKPSVQEVKSYVLKEIQSFSEAQHVDLYINTLGYPKWDDNNKEFNTLAPLKVINSDSVLWKELDLKTQAEFNKEYAHWTTRKGLRVLLDEHPNEKAHEIIARNIRTRLEKNYKK